MSGSEPLPPWISGLVLQGDLAEQYKLESDKEKPEAWASGNLRELVLDGLAPITIFVGANNSGKSRLMRELCCQTQFSWFKLSATTHEGIQGLSEPILRMVQTASRGGNHSKIKNHEWMTHYTDSNSQYLDSQAINRYLETIPSEIKRVHQGDKLAELITCQDEMNRFGLGSGIRNDTSISRCYVPMMRGMRPPVSPNQPAHSTTKDGEIDVYERRTKVDYFSANSTRERTRSGDLVRVFTGLGLYADLRKRLLGRTQEVRKTVRDYESYLSENFFAGQPVILVPVEEENNDVVHIKIGKDAERPIHQLGDGLQSLIISTYPIFTETKKSSLFFLEEPDLGMHPSLQRNFLHVLKERHRAQGHQFFITTHSNHLLDLLEDDELVSLFTFSEIDALDIQSNQAESSESAGEAAETPRFRIRQTSNRDRSALVALGVRPSVTYLANATIWVEGTTDRSYLRVYMEAFVEYMNFRGGAWGASLAERLKRYKEDRHYAFIEYNGTNLTHFDFSEERQAGDPSVETDPETATTSAPNLCAQAIVIADGDIEEKGVRENKFSSALQGRFVKLPGKEIENLIPEDLMIKQVEKSRPRKDTSMQLHEENTEDPKQIRYSNYARARNDQGKYLGVGHYLEDLGLSGYAAPGGKNDSRGSGTLSRHYKPTWASDSKGIPWQMRQEFLSIQPPRQDVFIGSSPDSGDPQLMESNAPLPSFLTQDIVWLCLLIFVHLARANHDEDVRSKLEAFKSWICDTKYPSTSARPAEAAAATRSTANGAWRWPIPDPSEAVTNGAETNTATQPHPSRSCLLTEFLNHHQTQAIHPAAAETPPPTAQASLPEGE